MEFSSTIKVLVSGKKVRYREDGFNLDLTYIFHNIIAMGFPAAKIEGVYRNHISDVYKFLETKHKNHYKIYNLCSERSYDVKRFHERVSTFPFDDHNPPTLEQIKPFCADVHEWLAKDSQNVAVVHCKAGKGRTGVMICCYLLHCRLYGSADEALKHYGQTRTQDTKGVTIPSQRRYVDYYDQLLKSGLEYSPTPLVLHELRLEPIPNFSAGCVPVLTVYAAQSQVQVTPTFELTKENGVLRMTLTPPLTLQGDVRVTLKNKPNVMLLKEKMFHFWFNTHFVKDRRVETRTKQTTTINELNNSSSLTKTAGLAFNRLSENNFNCSTTNLNPNLLCPGSRASSLNSICTDASASSEHVHWLTITLNKDQLDKARKGKNHRVFDSDFKVTLYMTRSPAGEQTNGVGSLPVNMDSAGLSYGSGGGSGGSIVPSNRMSKLKLKSVQSAPFFPSSPSSANGLKRPKDGLSFHKLLGSKPSSPRSTNKARNPEILCTAPICWRPSDSPSRSQGVLLDGLSKPSDLNGQPFRRSDSSTWSSEDNDSSDVDTFEPKTATSTTAPPQREQDEEQGESTYL